MPVKPLLRYTAYPDYGQGEHTGMHERNTRLALLLCVAAAVGGCGRTAEGPPRADAAARKDDGKVVDAISNHIGFANANAAATPFLDPSLASDPIVFPPPDQRRRLFVQAEDSPEQARALTRIWERFKTGQ